MAAETIARYYRQDRNPEGAFFPGVPLRDLTEADLAALPEWLRTEVLASPLYTTRRPPAPADASAAEEGPTDG